MNDSANGAGFRYSAFISYSREDERWAKWLQSALESYRIPRRLIGTKTAFGTLARRLPPVFRDRSDLSATTDLNETIKNARFCIEKVELNRKRDGRVIVAQGSFGCVDCEFEQRHTLTGPGIAEHYPTGPRRLR